MITGGSAFIVAIIEVSPAYQGDLHRLEVAGRDGEVVRRDQGFARLHDIAFGQNDAVAVLLPNGIAVVAPAAATPGNRRIESSARFIRIRKSPSLRYRDCGASVDAVTTPLVVKPGSTASKWRKLASSSPAPASSTKASPISALTRPWRNLRVRAPLVPVRPLSRSMLLRLILKALAIGTSPTSTPTTTASPRADKNHGAVDAHFLRPGKTVEPDRRHRSQERWTEQHARDAACPCHQHVFHDHLARELGSARAQCQSRGDFLAPDAPARQRQVGDVQSSNQQHERRSAPQQVQRAFYVFDQHVLKRFDFGVEARIDEEVLQLRETVPGWRR